MGRHCFYLYMWIALKSNPSLSTNHLVLAPGSVYHGIKCNEEHSYSVGHHFVFHSMVDAALRMNENLCASIVQL